MKIMQITGEILKHLHFKYKIVIKRDAVKVATAFCIKTCKFAESRKHQLSLGIPETGKAYVFISFQFYRNAGMNVTGNSEIIALFIRNMNKFKRFNYQLLLMDFGGQD